MPLKWLCRPANIALSAQLPRDRSFHNVKAVESSVYYFSAVFNLFNLYSKLHLPGRRSQLLKVTHLLSLGPKQPFKYLFLLTSVLSRFVCFSWTFRASFVGSLKQHKLNFIFCCKTNSLHLKSDVLTFAIHFLHE